jgi:hypothetical protein
MKAPDKQIKKYFKNHVTLSKQALNVIYEGADTEYNTGNILRINLKRIN